MSGARPTPPSRPKIAMVSTRELDGQTMAGRLHTAQAIRHALGEVADLTSLVLPDVLTRPSLARAISTALAWVGALAAGSPLPFQCALFANGADHRRLLDAIPADVEAIYLDGVRSYAFLKRLRRERPDVYVVVDFDDLMSRRMSLLLQTRQSLSPGYLTKRLPALLQRLMMSPGIGRVVVRFERGALINVERRVADLADVIVLLSAEDTRIFSLQAPGPARAAIEVIAPPAPKADRTTPMTTPDRFVFIGSDALTQNRLTIEYLTDLWGRREIKTPLVLVGLRASTAPLPPNVSSTGYVSSIADVYDGRSILLTPSLIGGGIKTKVLEAFDYGAPVIGNALTFESMDLEDYPLVVADEARIIELVSDPGRYAELFQNAVDFGRAYLKRRHDPAVLADRWRRVMRLPTRRQPTGAPS